jgi:hypothetical protein
MGYGRYRIHGGVHDGEDGGYAVHTTCDDDTCPERIDRGLAYLCGPAPGGGEDSCGGYFCGAHLVHTERGDVRCAACAATDGNGDDE